MLLDIKDADVTISPGASLRVDASYDARYFELKQMPSTDESDGPATWHVWFRRTSGAGSFMHMMHQMDEDARIDADVPRNNDCCDSDVSCTGDCSTGVSVSFITQSAVMLPVLNKTAFNPLVSNHLVFRDPTPPLRPPANLQI